VSRQQIQDKIRVFINALYLMENGSLQPATLMKFNTYSLRKLFDDLITKLTSNQISALEAIIFRLEGIDDLVTTIDKNIDFTEQLKIHDREDNPVRVQIIQKVVTNFREVLINLIGCREQINLYLNNDFEAVTTTIFSFEEQNQEIEELLESKRNR
jgi:hypothetical protein